MRTLRSLSLAALLVLAALAPGNLRAGERPVVLVPGITGSMLRAADGEVVFGETGQFLRPHDGGYRLARAIEGESPVFEAFDIIRELRIPGIYKKAIYQPIVDLLTEAGFLMGDIGAPQEGDSLFLFAYDWRLDNVENAGRLAKKLSAIAAATGSSKVDLICQSNGAHLCRYAARFGATDLESVEKGEVERDGRPPVGHMILVGASNGGSLRILRELNQGRRYIPTVGRRFYPEVFFTFPSLYQDLPHLADGLFVDAQGRPMQIDLYDVETWRRFGWSIFAPEVRDRLEDASEKVFGNAVARVKALASKLNRGRRFQQLLAANEMLPRIDSLHLIENESQHTPSKAALIFDGESWRTIFAGDRWLDDRPEIAQLLVAPGDGHSTVESQRTLTAAERSLLGAPPKRVKGGHFEMLLEKETQSYLLGVLKPR